MGKYFKNIIVGTWPVDKYLNFRICYSLDVSTYVGKLVDGREIMVQFAKYGPNAERM